MVGEHCNNFDIRVADRIDKLVERCESDLGLLGQTRFERVVVSEQASRAFNDAWNSQPIKEHAFCVYGRIVDGTVYAQTAVLSDSVGNSTSVRFIPCQSNIFQYYVRYVLGYDTLLGGVHNHPNKVCQMSEQDIYTFATTNWRLAGIICDENVVAFYSPTQLTNSAEVKIYG